MPVYICPKCGCRKELPEGRYYHKACGEDAIMVALEEYEGMKSDFKRRIWNAKAELIVLREDVMETAPVLYRKIEEKIDKALTLLTEMEQAIEP